MDSESEFSRESSLETEFDDDELKADLEGCIDNVEAAGSFALFESANHAPNPGIFIKGAGVIGLPLSDRDAGAVVAASHQAPFGKGSQTIIDTSIRKTWELSASEFEIQNPSWIAFIDSVLSRVKAGLGVAEGKGVKAELYKLLLYEKGAMFKPHQDSEKAPRMFGTLVVALPSSHQGGEVVITHAGCTRTLSTSQRSHFDISWMAWYSDVTHEVRPVTSGRRLVLTYNLVHTTATKKATATASFYQLQRLKNLLKSWDMNAVISQHSGLAYILEHKYSDASICFENLKGRDQQTVGLLRSATEDDQQCFVCLANIERQVSGGCDEDEDDGDYYYGGRSSTDYHEITEETDTVVTCSKVVDLDGKLIATNLKIEDGDFVQENPFEDVDPDEEDYEGYTGNEGTSAIQYYRRTVVLIVPRRARMEYFVSFSGDYRYSIGLYSGANQNSDSSKAMYWFEKLQAEFNSASPETLPLLRVDFQSLSNKIIEVYLKWKRQSWDKNPPFTNAVFDTVLRVALDVLKDENSISSAWALCGREAGDKYYDLGCVFWRYNLSAFLPKLNLEISRISKFSERIKALRRLAAALTHMKAEAAANKAPDFNAAEEMMQWIKEQVWAAIDILPLETIEDGKELLDIEWLGAECDVFSQRIIPAVRRNISKVTMVAQILADIIERPSLAALADGSALPIMTRELLVDFVDNLDIQYGCEPSLLDPNVMRMGAYRRPLLAAQLEKARDLAVILCQYQLYGMSEELKKILMNLSDQAKTVPVEGFDSILLPTLEAILSRLEKSNLTSPSDSFSSLFQSVLASYVCRYVDDPPSTPTDWTLPRRGCMGSCRDCQALDAFLIDPRLHKMQFPMAAPRRKHLCQRLDSTECTYTTTTEGIPHTLWVRKTGGGHAARVSAHQQKCSLAKKHISDLGLPKLRGLLREYFDDIVECRTSPLLRRLLDGTPALASSSGNIARRSAERVLPPISRRKIPGGGTITVHDTPSGDVEVIDIMDD